MNLDYRKDYRKLKHQLMEKFDGKCAYCGVKLYEPSMASIEHFYPKSLYPHLENEPTNLLLACNTCDMMKGAGFPLDDNGKPLLINPAIEKFSDHIVQKSNGYLEGLTEKGRETISVLKLNRPALIEQRILDEIYMKFYDDRTLSEHEIYMTFKTNMKKLLRLNEIELSSDIELNKAMVFMFYANAITSLETYLCDRFISLVQSKNKYLRSFVEKFHDYKDEMFSLTELFSKYDEIKSKAIESMKGVIYHNLPKVSGMYRDTFGIEFPKFPNIYKSVGIRHDIVHRGGKTKDGKLHDLDRNAVEQIISECSKFVEQLEKELKELE